MTALIILAPANLYQEAWRGLLSGQPAIEVIATIGTLHALRDFIPLNQPAATVLIDVPKPDPIIAQQIKGMAPSFGVLFLVDHYELSEMVTLLRAGAAGCLVRDGTVAELVQGIVAAGRDEIVLPPEWATKALLALARGEVGEKRPSFAILTDREQDVLRLLAQGMTNKDIAQALFLSVRTIEAHLRHIFNKLDVQSRTEAVLWAVTHGFE